MKIDIKLLKNTILELISDIATEMNTPQFKELDRKSFTVGKFEGELLGLYKVFNIITDMEEYRNKKEELNEMEKQ
ncbi:hypothetical protein HKO22_03105 [Peptoniphilus sp. AGMB00490]|uniref:Uncharacterized protein n=1 Tax=Peptoniphilus faecalis TaxID=2731255 RepID=A0A848RH33_9FIRM|nr:hypothetical protein [Peptoniphilus faecalis]NMW84733.1 hypothetical protein [Peptoniphilus faecalis]